jgi:hypothetical protein
MRKILLAALGFMALPGLAWAEKGSGTDRDRVSRDVEAMQRDGRWEKAIAEGRANERAFDALRQAAPPTATGAIGARARR